MPITLYLQKDQVPATDSQIQFYLSSSNCLVSIVSSMLFSIRTKVQVVEEGCVVGMCLLESVTCSSLRVRWRCLFECVWAGGLQCVGCKKKSINVYTRIEASMSFFNLLNCTEQYADTRQQGYKWHFKHITCVYRNMDRKV